MKQKNVLAPISLLFATVVFLATLPLADSFIVGLIRAFAEASMVGGLADWFAVVALFRHPLGIPIPHTAILPGQRKKLTAGIIDMVQNTWLAKSAIQERIRRWNILDRIVQAAEDPMTRASLQRMIRSAHADSSRFFSPAGAAAALTGVLRERITTEDLLDATRRFAESGLSQNLHQSILTSILPNVTEWMRSERVRLEVEANLRRILEQYANSTLRKIGKWMAEQSNVLDYADLAGTMVRTLVDEVEGLRQNPDHPLRIEFDKAVRSAVESIDTDASLHGIVDDMRKSALASPAFTESAARVLARLDAWLQDDLDRDDSVVMRFLFDILDRQIDRIRHDEAFASAVESWIQDRIISFVDSNHQEIGILVQHNLEKLSDQQLVEQIEAKVGKDLQYIRVNGAVVGGMVGAALHLLKSAIP